MLSARHHVCYWVLSITTALVYQGLVVGLGFQEEVFRIALIPLMGFAIYIIWNGPGHLSNEWHIHQQVATACLMLCLGSVSGHLNMSDASVEKVKPMFHIFLAFSTISALESIRQNRNDIQPCIYVCLGFDFEIGTKYWGWDGAFFYFYSYLFVLLVFCGVYFLLALALAIIFGPEVSKETMNCIYMALSEISDSGLVLMYALVSLADIAVTIFYQIHRYVYPRLVPEPKPFICPNDGWRLLKSSTANSFIRWALISFMVSVSRWRGIMPQAKTEIQNNGTWIGQEYL